ncbi:50S ribosomal protein L4 [Afifella marina]|uniref:Large ribosomal subunit protein uL4 n=1 Tax=Afifella marina DSM 2698 TaxID=1120955 RepID=A0A1G5PA60_AFIMA|nr:50S ribosomal protein L4 [Afifella marina]MBK1625448.1 50S ribosomal protein L4 [Afifella marina DSM 2698]MBK1629067.1 50S ribosomal protein L4 [Afifella marina]MBK5917346.1 50S ribosomal protein L4 [Afifella marina]RAI17482.1 50S ribosomal protein L4 [Afifella marina DSM 2698]SCZ46436.1 large subunit ribosomal protein L4 [Afifella marina DSM 2698]
MELQVTTLAGESAGQVSVSDEVFGLEPRQDLLQRMIRYQLLKRQAGTHKAKDRGEVSMTTAKMYRQKGTGRARHGSKKPGVFRGGGKSHGPVARSHAIELPKKVRALALKHALSVRARTETLIVIDDAKAGEAKTKGLAAQFAGLGLNSVLIVDGAQLDDNFAKAARNLRNVDVLPVQGINVYDILRREKLVLTKSAIEALEERFK